MHLTDEERALAQKTGSSGGKETLKRLGKEHFKKIAKGWPKGKPRKKPVIETLKDTIDKLR